MIEARAQITGLTDLRRVAYDFLLWHGRRVVGEVAEEVPKVLLLAALDQESRDVHVNVHTEMPIGHARINVSGTIQPEEGRLNRRERQGAVGRHISQRNRWRPAEVVAENVKLFNAFCGKQSQHILGDGLWLVAVVRF